VQGGIGGVTTVWRLVISPATATEVGGASGQDQGQENASDRDQEAGIEEECVEILEIEVVVEIAEEVGALQAERETAAGTVG